LLLFLFFHEFKTKIIMVVTPKSLRRDLLKACV
jgi:hypothetical protein